MTEANNRDVGLDLVRVVATGLVVMVHVTANWFAAWDYQWATTNALGSLSRVAVPLFVMASGAIILFRQERIGKTGGRVAKILIPLLAWSVIYFVWQRLTGVTWGFIWTESGNNPLQFFWKVIQSPIAFNLPFLYALVGLYLFYPILQSAFRSADYHTRVYMLGAYVVGASFIQTAAKLAAASVLGFDVSMFALFPMYAVLGAMLMSVPAKPLTLPAAWAGAALATLATALATYFLSVQKETPSQVFYEYSSPTVVLAAAFFFVALRNSARVIGSTLTRLVAFLSPLSFGVFFVHIIIVFYTLNLFPASGGPLWVYQIGVTVFVLVVSYAISWLFRRVGLGKLLGAS